MNTFVESGSAFGLLAVYRILLEEDVNIHPSKTLCFPCAIMVFSTFVVGIVCYDGLHFMALVYAEHKITVFGRILESFLYAGGGLFDDGREEIS